MADANKMKELLGKKKIVLKPAAAPAPKPAPLVGPDDDEKVTLERPVPSSPANNEPTVEGDVTALADSTRPPKPDGNSTMVSEPVLAPPRVAPVSLPPATAPKAGQSGADQIVEKLMEQIRPHLNAILQPFRQELAGLKSQIEALSGKVDTHEEDMTQLNDEVEKKMGVDALRAVETAVNDLAKKLDALSGKVDTHEEDMKQLNEDLEGKASAEEMGQLKAAFQVVAGDDYERVHGIAQDYQEATTRLMVDFLLDLTQDNVNELVEVMERRGADLSKKLLVTFTEVPDIVSAEVARRKGFKLSELSDMDSITTSERALSAAGAKVEVDQETERVLNNARYMLSLMEGEA